MRGEEKDEEKVDDDDDNNDDDDRGEWIQLLAGTDYQIPYKSEVQ